MKYIIFFIRTKRLGWIYGQEHAKNNGLDKLDFGEKYNSDY